jgi:pyruvate/2-oxoglutarate dehydrogenase complex dihydrolipoamide acyltransferase (E2) component
MIPTTFCCFAPHRQYHNIDVNVAVNSPAGLMVPFVRDADKKGLLAISQEVKELAAKVGTRRSSTSTCTPAATSWTAA